MAYDLSQLEQVRDSLSKQFNKPVSPMEAIQYLADQTGMLPSQVMREFGIEESDSVLGSVWESTKAGLAQIPESLAKAVDYGAAVLTPPPPSSASQSLTSGHEVYDAVTSAERGLFGLTGKEYAEYTQLAVDPETRRAFHEIDSAKSPLETAAGYLTNPRAAFVRAPGAIIPSLPSSIAAGLLGGMVAGPGGAAFTAAAVPSAAETFHEAVQDNAQHGVDGYTSRQLGTATLSGTGVGAISLATGYVSRALGGETVDTILAKVLTGRSPFAAAAEKTQRSGLLALARGGLTSGAAEAADEFFESGLESVSGDIAKGQPVDWTRAGIEGVHGAAAAFAYGGGAHIGKVAYDKVFAEPALSDLDIPPEAGGSGASSSGGPGASSSSDAHAAFGNYLAAPQFDNPFAASVETVDDAIANAKKIAGLDEGFDDLPDDYGSGSGGSSSPSGSTKTAAQQYMERAEKGLQELGLETDTMTPFEIQDAYERVTQTGDYAPRTGLLWSAAESVPFDPAVPLDVQMASAATETFRRGDERLEANEKARTLYKVQARNEAAAQRNAQAYDALARAGKAVDEKQDNEFYGMLRDGGYAGGLFPFYTAQPLPFTQRTAPADFPTKLDDFLNPSRVGVTPPRLAISINPSEYFDPDGAFVASEAAPYGPYVSDAAWQAKQAEDAEAKEAGAKASFRVRQQAEAQDQAANEQPRHDEASDEFYDPFYAEAAGHGWDKAPEPTTTAPAPFPATPDNNWLYTGLFGYRLSGSTQAAGAATPGSNARTTKASQTGAKSGTAQAPDGKTEAAQTPEGKAEAQPGTAQAPDGKTEAAQTPEGKAEAQTDAKPDNTQEQAESKTEGVSTSEVQPETTQTPKANNTQEQAAPAGSTEVFDPNTINGKKKRASLESALRSIAALMVKNTEAASKNLKNASGVLVTLTASLNEVLDGNRVFESINDLDKYIADKLKDDTHHTPFNPNLSIKDQPSPVQYALLRSMVVFVTKDETGGEFTPDVIKNELRNTYEKLFGESAAETVFDKAENKLTQFYTKRLRTSWINRKDDFLQLLRNAGLVNLDAPSAKADEAETDEETIQQGFDEGQDTVSSLIYAADALRTSGDEDTKKVETQFAEQNHYAEVYARIDNAISLALFAATPEEAQEDINAILDETTKVRHSDTKAHIVKTALLLEKLIAEVSQEERTEVANKLAKNASKQPPSAKRPNAGIKKINELAEKHGIAVTEDEVTAKVNALGRAHNTLFSDVADVLEEDDASNNSATIKTALDRLRNIVTGLGAAGALKSDFVEKYTKTLTDVIKNADLETAQETLITAREVLLKNLGIAFAFNDEGTIVFKTESIKRLAELTANAILNGLGAEQGLVFREQMTLPNAQRQARTIIDKNVAPSEREATLKLFNEYAKGTALFSVTQASVTDPTTPVALRDALAAAFGVRRLPFVQIFRSVAALSQALGMPVAPNTAAMVYQGVVYFVTDNIPRGQETSVIAHDLGAHAAVEAYADAQRVADYIADLLVLMHQGDATALQAAERAKASLDAAGLRPESPDYAHYFGRELLGYYVELTYDKATKPTLFQRIVGWVNRLLRKAGLRIAPAFVAAHVKALVDGALHRMASDTRLGVDPMLDAHRPSVALFSLANPAVAPRETTVLGNALPLTEGTSRGVVRGLWESTKTVLDHFSALDVYSETLDNLYERVTGWITAAARAEGVRDLQDRLKSKAYQVLPSFEKFYRNLKAREARAGMLRLFDDKLRLAFSALPPQFFETAMQLLSDARYYDTWVFDPSDWHMAILSEQRIQEYVKRRLDKGKDADVVNERAEQLRNRLKAIQESIQEQIKEGNRLAAQRVPVPSSYVAWRYHNLMNGKSADGKPLSAADARHARQAASAIQLYYRTLHAIVKEERQAIKQRIAPFENAANTAQKIITELEKRVTDANDPLTRESSVSDIPRGLIDFARTLVGLPSHTFDSVGDFIDALENLRKRNMNTVKQFLSIQNRALDNISPYAPQIRTGDHFMIVKSDLYRALELAAHARSVVTDALTRGGVAAVDAVVDEINDYAKRSLALLKRVVGDPQKMGDYTERVLEIYEEMRDLAATNDLALFFRDPESKYHALRLLLNDLKSDANHYGVFSFILSAERRNAHARLLAYLEEVGNPTGLTPELVNHKEALNGARITNDLLSSLLATIRTSGVNPEVQAMLEQAIHRLYLQTYAAKITVQARQMYRHVYGFDPSTLMHVTSEYINETARFVASMEHNDKIEEALKAMHAEADRPNGILDDRDRRFASQVVSTVTARWNQLRTVERSSGVTEALLSAVSTHVLTTNPSFFLINSMQGAAIALPLISELRWFAGKKASNPIGKARAGILLAEATKLTSKAVAAGFRAFDKLIDDFDAKRQEMTLEAFDVLLPQKRIKEAIKLAYASKGEAYVSLMTSIIDDLAANNLLDMGLNVEMGDVTAVTAQVQRMFGENVASTSLKKVAGVISKVPALGRSLTQGIEATNRAAAALAIAQGLLEVGHLDPATMTDAEKAKLVEHARTIVSDAFGNYARYARPTLFASRRLLPRLATQFRYFSLVMTRTLIKLVRNGYFNADLTPEERNMYRKQAINLLGHTALLFGVRGLPLIGPIFAMLMAMGIACDEDSGDCERMRTMDTSAAIDTKLRQTLGDGMLADQLSGGLFYALLNADISARAGLSNVMSIMPFDDDYLIDAFKNPEKAQEAAIKLFGGAGMNTFVNIIRGAQLMSSSDYGSYNWLRGLAYASPLGVRNVLYALAWSQGGIKTRSLDTVLPAKALDEWDYTLKVFGFQPRIVSEAYWRHGNELELKRAMADTRSQIMRKYYEAYVNKDIKRMRQARAEWKAYVNKALKLKMPVKNPKTALDNYVKNKRRKNKDLE